MLDGESDTETLMGKGSEDLLVKEEQTARRLPEEGSCRENRFYRQNR